MRRPSRRSRPGLDAWFMPAVLTSPRAFRRDSRHWRTWASTVPAAHRGHHHSARARCLLLSLPGSKAAVPRRRAVCIIR